MMLLVATLILFAGFVDDMRSRKVHNWLVLAAAVVAVVASLALRGWSGTQLGLMALALAIVVTIPVYFAKVVGGGDVKLVWAFALATEPTAIFWTLTYSIFWGALFGLTRSALQGQLPVLVKNTFRLATRRRSQQPMELHKIPYTFALLMGWCTHLTMIRWGAM